MQKEKTKRIVNIVANAVCVLIMVFVLTLTISTLVAPTGMSAFCGYGYLAVETDSMAGDKEDNFNSKDIIYVNLLSDKEKANLKVGDIVTFLDTINGKIAYNTHRIVEILENTDGKMLYYTKGDANELRDPSARSADEIVGKYVGQAKGIGSAILWMQSPSGYVVCVIIPGILVLIYSVISVVMATRAYSKNKLAKAEQDIRSSVSEELKEQLKRQLLEELKNENNGLKENKDQ